MGKFRYFAFGSNLLKERIHISNPSAVKLSIGRVDGYRLDFNYFSKRWQGAAATIEEDSNQHVWGVIWELDEEHQTTLDQQESVHLGVYQPISVTAVTPAGQTLSCRSYQLITPPEQDRRPSAVYKDVIVRGATENGLPDDYLTFLTDIEDNGYRGDVDVSLDLGQR